MSSFGEITYQTRNLIFAPKSDSLMLMRIRALCRAYGFGRSFIKYYGSESALVCVQDGVAVCWFGDKAAADELAPSLGLLAGVIMSDVRLCIDGLSESDGTIFKGKTNAKRESAVTDELKSVFPIVSRVFSDEINQTNYTRWYTDLSHRVRHGMSRVYTVKNKSSLTVYCAENGVMLLAQLATIPEERRKGYAQLLISHAAADCGAGFAAALSQNSKSDEFYRRLGFSELGKWYCYGK